MNRAFFTQTSHNNNFDALRLIAALSVLWGHMFPLSSRPEPLFFHMTAGLVAVATFFTISGYLVTQSWMTDPHVGRFFARRLLRLWPGLLVVVLLCSFVVAPLVSGHSMAELFKDPQYMRWFRNLLFDPFHKDFDAFNKVLPYKAINGAIWTIPLEFLCYVLVALLAVGHKLHITIPLLLFGLLVAFCLAGGESWIAGLKHPGPWFYLGRFGVFFFIGSLFYLYPKHIFNWLTCLSMLAGGVGFMFAGEYTLGLTLALPSIIIPFGKDSWPIVRNMGKYGDFSYGIYIYAWPIQQTLVWALGSATSIWVLQMHATLLALAFAILSWYLVEKPALSLKPSQRHKKHEALSQTST